MTRSGKQLNGINLLNTLLGNKNIITEQAQNASIPISHYICSRIYGAIFSAEYVICLLIIVLGIY